MPERAQLVVGAGWTQDVPYAALRQLPHATVHSSAEAATDSPARRLALAESLTAQHRNWESAPPVILLDDPHLMDAPSLQVLTQLAHQMRTTSTVLVIAASSEVHAGVDPDFSRVMADPGTLQLQIPALVADDVVALARERGFHDINSQGVAAVLEHSGGRLRVAEEILAEVPQGAWPADPDTLPIPRSVVRDVLGPIRDSGSEDLWRLVATLAVLEESSDLTRIAEVAGVADLSEAVDLAVASGVVREARSAGLSLLELIHPAAQRIIIAEMKPSERRALHSRAATCVEHAEDQLIHRAAAAQGQDPDLACALQQAAVAAEYQGRWRDSARLHFAASGVLPRSAPRDAELLKGVDALASAGNVAQALPWLGVAKSIAPSPERDVVLANLALHRGKAAEAHDLLQRASAAEPADQEVHAQIALRRTLDALVRWDGEDLCDWADRAMQLSPPDSPTYIESRAMRGVGLAARGRLDEATATIRELAAENVSGAHSQRFHLCVGWVSLLAGNLREAVRALESAVPTQQLRGSLRISLWAQGWLARVQLLLGEWDDALRTADDGLRQCHEAGIELVTPLLHWTSAEVRLCRGQPTDEVLGGTRSRAFFSDYLAMQVPERCTRAISAYVRGDHEARAAALRPLLSEDPWTSGRGSFWPWHADLVDALIAADSLVEAQRAAADFRRYTSDASAHVRALAEAACARVAGAAGDAAAAEQHFARALDLVCDDQYPTDRARILLSRGQVLRRVNRRRDAMESLERAREFYQGVGAKVLVERCEQELRATGMSWGGATAGSAGEARDSTSGNAVVLTPQELSVANLVVQGMTNAEVARELFIAEKTVQYHLTRIYGKFRIRSRTELATVHFAEDSRPH
ncbi:hypothetical protein FEF27_00875 [Nesterenkonia sphaerica]|uniref:HTH luxR-type domain-containing protein n=2 Tax=Nesterenkonia sphaerica TaxID=1804988 RepID=A0A5R9AME2_9MICC|nr:LuxR family transcriptional regulator [Nesterenkonia sphaerica]TLP79971.1 hypothetical protein FEF27_00875 [Nesterenkonia sphaerica]